MNRAAALVRRGDVPPRLLCRNPERGGVNTALDIVVIQCRIATTEAAGTELQAVMGEIGIERH